MIIHRDDVQAVFKFKELKAYCVHKEACEECVFYYECPFRYCLRQRAEKIEKAACTILVSGELGDDLKEGDKNE